MKLYLSEPDSGTAAHEPIWGGIGLAALLAARWLPLDRLGLSLCPLKTITGLPCFLCGGTRGFVAAVHFDLPLAWGFNPIAFLLALGLLVYVPYSLAAFTLSWPRPRARLEPGWERVVARTALLGAAGIQWAFLLLRGV